MDFLTFSVQLGESKRQSKVLLPDISLVAGGFNYEVKDVSFKK